MAFVTETEGVYCTVRIKAIGFRLVSVCVCVCVCVSSVAVTKRRVVYLLALSFHCANKAIVLSDCQTRLNPGNWMNYDI